MAASPWPSRGPKRGWMCYVTPAFSEVPNAKRGEKITSGCLTLAFSGAQKRAEVLRNPCILGGPQHQVRGENQKRLRSRGPKRGRKCYVTPAFSEVPNAKREEKFRSGCLFGCPKGNRYATAAFSAVPNAKRGEKIRSGFILGGPKEGRIAT